MRPVTWATATPCMVRSRRSRFWSAKTLSKKSIASASLRGAEGHARPPCREVGAQTAVGVAVDGVLHVVEAVEGRPHAAELDMPAGAQPRKPYRLAADLEELARAPAVQCLRHHLRALGV